MYILCIIHITYTYRYIYIYIYIYIHIYIHNEKKGSISTYLKIYFDLCLYQSIPFTCIYSRKENTSLLRYHRRPFAPCDNVKPCKTHSVI